MLPILNKLPDEVLNALIEELKPYQYHQFDKGLQQAIVRIKNEYPSFHIKHILAKLLFDFLQDPSVLSSDPFYPVMREILNIADNFLNENQFDRFTFIMNELSDYLEESDLKNPAMQKIARILSMLESPKIIQNEARNKAALELSPIETPPALLTLLKQKGFQSLCTHYCTAISGLVNIYFLIHQQVAIHEQEGLRYEDFYKAFTNLIGVDPNLIKGQDLAQNMINAFYVSDFYKTLINSKNYAEKYFVVTGPIDFRDGSSFNQHIQDCRSYDAAFTSRSIEIRKYLQHLLNIAVCTVVKNSTNSLFRIAYSGNLLAEDVLCPVKLVYVTWLGQPHSALQIPEGLINAPSDFIGLEDACQFVLQKKQMSPEYQLNTTKDNTEPSADASTEVVMTNEDPLNNIKKNRDILLEDSTKVVLIEPVLQKHLNQLMNLCMNYKDHLNATRNSKDSKARNKLHIVNELITIIETDQWSYETRIEHLKAILTKDKKALLGERRDSSMGARFLEAFLNILSLGIYSKITKGNFCFWKSHGEVFSNDFASLVLLNEVHSCFF